MSVCDVIHIPVGLSEFTKIFRDQVHLEYGAHVRQSKKFQHRLTLKIYRPTSQQCLEF